jgi:hypothetical protein
MKRLFAPLAALVLVLATAVPATAADPARPLHGSWVSPDGYDFAASGCPADAFLRFTTSGHGQFAHLGRTSITMAHCTWVDPVANTGSFDLGPIILTAANGDTLVLGHRGTFTLTPNPAGMPPYTSALSSLIWWVESGTGRFADADGSGTGTSFDDMLTGIQRFVLEGAISY